MFGGLSYAEGGAELPAEIAHIARDPFDPLFDLDAAAAGLRRRKTGLKRALLDQTVVSGIGNIYADEALWRAKLHYAKATETLKPQQAKEILGHARAVMAEALDVGGTSFDALYVNVNGESGYFERGLRGLRPGRLAVPARRPPDPARTVHEPFLVPLPEVSAGATTRPVVSGKSMI